MGLLISSAEDFDPRGKIFKAWEIDRLRRDIGAVSSQGAS
jgi:hypothetical protein